MGDPRGTRETNYVPCCLLTSKMRQDMHSPLAHPTYPTPTLVPTTKPIYGHVSMDTRSREGSATMFCDELVGVLHHCLCRATTSAYVVY